MTSLSRRGYGIPKADLVPEDLRLHQRNLTVKPFVLQEYAATVKPFPVYGESAKRLYVPRHYGLQTFGTPQRVLLSEYETINVAFKGQLRAGQIPAANAFLKECPLDKTPNSYNLYTKGGIIALYPGAGKTVVSLHVISKLKAKTLVVVHKTFLMNQWKERIKTFLPDARVGIIQQNNVDIEDKDIVIAMLQSISMKDYPKDTFRSFGLCVVDECHHLAAEVFSRCLSKIGSEFTLGLSGTPDRADGLSKVFEWWIGPILYHAKRPNDIKVNAIQLKINDKSRPYSTEELTQMGKVCMARMVNNVCAYHERTKLIVHILGLLVKEGRTILVLSSRRQHLIDIHTLCTTEKTGTVGFYVGGMKQEDLVKSESKQIILGTYNMAAEGLDIKQLNTILFATPMTNVVQAVGRILRKKHANITPEIYDIVDNFSSFVNQGVKRRRFYCREKYPVFCPEIATCTDANTITSLSQLRIQKYSRRKKQKNENKCLFLP